MKTRALLTSILATGALLLTTALPAQAADAYTDPLTRGDNVLYNNHTYALSINPVTTAKVTRFGHSVPSTYRARIIEATKTGDKVLYSGTLGYYRAAYLRTKLGSFNTTRNYGIATYVKKVTGFSADYAKTRVNTYVVNYREKTLRGDVTATAQNINDYIATHNQSLTGIENDPNVIVKSDGFFGYNDNDNLSINISVEPGANPKVYYVTGIEKADLYQSVYDGNTGAIRSGHITTVSNLF